ncbi:branched-subunit amino acid transport protein [Natranaerovirga hydrolytica]|uniref:Branched-subunit amino acid transport protein n=1 Tax=Natranaerovirga hydrolytica TaxID=680378 RepID=A0A4R1M9B8_9FIRM|nr:AzlD domain-containing protein [Natranaerovirga hydrolytica]TCK87970.1 branched-subunit amino acid transport protein [Natranaerovirga hydrolytica]
MKLYITILLMAIVTYVPRVLPMVQLNDKTLSPKVAKFLSYIPFAALGALIFPDILYSTSHVLSAAAGTILAIVAASCKINIVWVIVAGIMGVYLIELML